jgi:hypothetical protein
MTDQSESFRRGAIRLLQTAKHAPDEDTRAALMALVKRYLELAKAAASNRWSKIGSTFRILI